MTCVDVGETLEEEREKEIISMRGGLREDDY